MDILAFVIDISCVHMHVNAGLSMRAIGDIKE
jgi:hypothetical protein